MLGELEHSYATLELCREDKQLAHSIGKEQSNLAIIHSLFEINWLQNAVLCELSRKC